MPQSSCSALHPGLGWGYMPEAMAREEGRLVRIDVPEYKDGFGRLHAIYRMDYTAGASGILAYRPVCGSGDRT